MSRPLSPRAQDILAQLEREADERRASATRDGSDTPKATAVPPEPAPRRPSTLRPSGPPLGVLELVDAAEDECRRVRARLTCATDALAEVTKSLRDAGPAGRRGR